MADEQPANEVNETPAPAPADEPKPETDQLTDTTNEEPAAPENPKTEPSQSKFRHLHQAKLWYKTHLKIAIPATILAVLLLLMLIPATRFDIVGLFLKKDFTVQVVDSSTKAPVSGAAVSIGSLSTQSDGNGHATLHVKVGKQVVHIVKKYYTDTTANVTVPILKQKSFPQVGMTATGRQAKIIITNTISKKPVAKITIKVGDVTVETDSAGTAIIVLPPGVPEQKATLSGSGYNETSVTLKVSDTTVAENKYSISPAGKIYFLSKRTGKIDVMKSNLDGSDQKVVLAGTGTESDTDTILLASRDWKYLALKSKRDNSPAKLYYIDTSVDKLNTLDEGNADFQLVGWAGDTFVYQITRNGMSAWQPNQEALKTFNAVNGKLTTINQTGGEGTDPNNYVREHFLDKYIIDNKIVYTKDWEGNVTLIQNKQAGIYSVNADGSSAKTLKTFSEANYIYIQSVLYEPREIYFHTQDTQANAEEKYYVYENDVVKEDASIKDKYNQFVSQPYPTYLLSPSAKQTYWVAPRDGKSSFLLGDVNGDNSKEIAKLDSKYLNYGYYTDDYLLVSKDNDEIYIMSSAGVKADTEMVKITDYHKPAYNFYGYGGGYGGL